MALSPGIIYGGLIVPERALECPQQMIRACLIRFRVFSSGKLDTLNLYFIACSLYALEWTAVQLMV